MTDLFTGIVEERGKLLSVKKGSVSAVLTISAAKVLQGTRVGDSIAVNGVCLTVTSLQSNSFTADVMAETLHRSTLGQLSVGAPLNLERALAAGDRLGGHIVSGHIDGTGRILSIRPEDNAVWYKIEAENKLLRYIVEKGSIAIDGISLTVVSVDDRSFQVSVIPHTRDVTTLSQKRVGDPVNLENDIIGKYVERLLGYGPVRQESQKEPEDKGNRNRGLTMDFLTEHGFN